MKRETFGVVLLLLFAVIMVGAIYCSMMSAAMVRGTGTVKALGLEIWGDEIGTIDLSVVGIDWGIIDPGTTVSQDFWVYNPGNAPITLSMVTSNWVPSNASNYIDLTWDYADEVVQPKTSPLGLTFDLSVSSNITGITDFSFEIIIFGSG